jgi:hypothetical protein
MSWRGRVGDLVRCMGTGDVVHMVLGVVVLLFISRISWNGAGWRVCTCPLGFLETLLSHSHLEQIDAASGSVRKQYDRTRMLKWGRAEHPRSTSLYLR